MKNSSIVQGALLALLAAVLFGASAPLVQKAGTHIGSWMTAALLYAGAAIAGWLLRSTTAQEAALQRQHWPRLLLMAFFGAVIGPAALAWGLQHTSGMSASLMLALEAVFTVALSSLFYREQIDRRVGLAILLLTSGGVLLVLDSTESGAPQVLGLLAVMGATATWGIDNTLSRALADIDPGRVVLGKAALGAVCSFLIAMATGPSTFPGNGTIDFPLAGRLRLVPHRRDRLRPQLAFLFAGTTNIRSRADRFRIRSRPFYRRAYRLWIRRTKLECVVDRRRGPDDGGRHLAHDGTARTRARARGDGARTRPYP